MQPMLDFGLGVALESQDYHRIARIYGEQYRSDSVARDRRQTGHPEHQRRGKYRQEEGEVAPGVDAGNAERDTSAPVAKAERRQPHHEQRDGRKHQRCPDYRAHADLAMGARHTVAHQ